MCIEPIEQTKHLKYITQGFPSSRNLQYLLCHLCYVWSHEETAKERERELGKQKKPRLK